MYYEEVLRLAPDVVNELRENTEGRFDDPDLMPMGENDSTSYDVVFEDGTIMQIRICGVKYEEGSDNAPYTEAVLMRNEKELAFSNPSEFGIDDEWSMSDDEGNTYCVTIEEEMPVMDNDQFMHYVQEHFSCEDYAFLIRDILDYFRDHNPFVDEEKAVGALMEIFGRISFSEDELYAVAKSWDYN